MNETQRRLAIGRALEGLTAPGVTPTQYGYAVDLLMGSAGFPVIEQRKGSQELQTIYPAHPRTILSRIKQTIERWEAEMDDKKRVGAGHQDESLERAEELEWIAHVCHEVNRAYCQALGDNSQPAWDDAPEWQRSSARMGVDLHSMGDFGPEASHVSWMKQKLDEGWKYGPVKDPEKKEHPCVVPFSELPREQQAKDFIFRAVVHALREGLSSGA